MILVPDSSQQTLHTVSSRGYAESGAGAEVKIGEGLIGTVAQARRPLRMSGLLSEMAYGRAVRERARQTGSGEKLAKEIPLPGLQGAQSQLAIPLVARGELLGVLVLESTNPLEFEDQDEAFLETLANFLAMAVQNAQLQERADEDTAPAARTAAPRPASAAPSGAGSRSLCYYREDECVFVDGEYLIRGVPAKILWKILTQYKKDRQSEFANKELRVDPWLQLPEVKDNLEARIILLRKRIEQKCPEIRLTPAGRGRFSLQLDCRVELEEK